MKNMMLCIAVLAMIMGSEIFAQSPVPANGWVPVLVNSTQYIQTTIPVTYYQNVTIPVNVPIIQYYQVPLVYYGPTYQPVVQIVRPCLFCPGRFYYINSPVKY